MTLFKLTGYHVNIALNAIQFHKFRPNNNKNVYNNVLIFSLIYYNIASGPCAIDTNIIFKM